MSSREERLNRWQSPVRRAATTSEGEETAYLVTARITFPMARKGELSELAARAEIEGRVALWDATVQYVETIEVDA